MRNSSFSKLKQNLIDLENFIVGSKLQEAVILERIDINSPQYDRTYDREIRTNRAELFAVLEELLYQSKYTGETSVSIIDSLEKKLLNSDIYRKAILFGYIPPLEDYKLNIAKKLSDEIQYIHLNSSEEDYKNIIADFGTLNIPSTKVLFLKKLKLMCSQLLNHTSTF